jgi:MFS family permease
MLGGLAADRIGRKRAFIVDMAIVVAGSALCAMAREPLLIVAGQFLIGVGIGIDFPASGSYVSEIMPRSLRSRMTVATIALQSVGMILAAIVAIAIFRIHPSATVGIWAIPRFGRISLQVAGFFGMTLGMLLLMFATMAGDGPQAHIGLIIAGFVLFNFSMNAGPNATTFTLPPILFPTAIRASASGFAAACAKVGATFGTFLVPQLQEAWGLTGVLALMAFVSVGGLVTTAAFAYAVDKEDELEESETVKGAHQPA